MQVLLFVCFRAVIMQDNPAMLVCAGGHASGVSVHTGGCAATAASAHSPPNRAGLPFICALPNWQCVPASPFMPGL